jgi:hypothetical protein
VRYNDNGNGENSRYEISRLPLLDIAAGNGAGAGRSRSLRLSPSFLPAGCGRKGDAINSLGEWHDGDHQWYYPADNAGCCSNPDWMELGRWADHHGLVSTAAHICHCGHLPGHGHRHRFQWSERLRLNECHNSCPSSTTDATKITLSLG